MGMNNIFLDTNIVVDLIQGRERMPKIQNTFHVVNQTEEFKLFVSANSVADIYYILRKQVMKVKIDEFLKEITILDSTGAGCEYAILNTNKHDDIEDIMQIACCNENKINTFITADPELIESYGHLFIHKTKIELIR
jgi:predicted nucleic acid-binding protein